MEIQELINNDALTQEEKDILVKKLAQQYLEDEKIIKRDELIENNKSKSNENKFNLDRINYNSSLKEQMEVLSFLKDKNGDNQFSKEYLQSLSGFKLMDVYEDCMNAMPEAMERAKVEREKAKDEEIAIFDDYNLNETKAKEEKELSSGENNKDEREVEEIESLTIDKIADRLGIDSDRVVDTVNYKNGRDFGNSEYLETNGKGFVEDDGKGRQKTSRIHSASEKLRNALNHKTVKAALVASAGIAGIALLVINAPVALGAAAVALVGNEINKGRKGR